MVVLNSSAYEVAHQSGVKIGKRPRAVLHLDAGFAHVPAARCSWTSSVLDRRRARRAAGSMVKRAPPPVARLADDRCRRGLRRSRGRSPGRGRRPASRFPCLPRSNFWKIASSRPLGRPGPWSSITMLDAVADGAGTDLDRRAGGRVLAGVLQQVAQHALEQHRIHVHQRQVRRQRRRARAADRACRPSLASALPTASSSGSHCRLQLHLARLQPRHVEQVVHLRAHAQRRLADRAARSAACGRSAAGCVHAPATRPCPPAPPAACAGRARSPPAANCAAAPIPSAPSRSAPRRRSGCAPARCATSDAQVSSSRRCSGPARRAGSRGSIASTPRMRIGAFSGRYRIGDAGSVSVPWPAASAWSNAHCAMPESMPAGSVGDGTGCLSAVVAASATISAARASNSDCRKRAGDLGDLLGDQRARQVARHLVQRARRAASRRCATRAWNFSAGGQLADDQRDHQHHAEGQQVLHVADTLNEKRGGT